MAVTIKKKAITLESLVKRLFTEEAGQLLATKANALVSTGHTLKTSLSVLSVLDAEGKVLASAHIKVEAVSAAMKGKIGITISTIRQKVEELISSAYDNMAVASVKQKPVFLSGVAAKLATMAVWNGGGSKVATIKKFRELTNCNLYDAKEQVDIWIDQAEIDEVIKTDTSHSTGTGNYTFTGTPKKPVHLKQATAVLQPVYGTSEGSLYHVIAIAPDVLVVAARIKGTGVALRVEILAPINSNTHKEARAKLLAAGLDKKGAGHYSLHLEPDSDAMVARCVGSTLFAIGSQFEGMLVDLSMVKGKGN